MQEQQRETEYLLHDTQQRAPADAHCTNATSDSTSNTMRGLTQQDNSTRVDATNMPDSACLTRQNSGASADPSIYLPALSDTISNLDLPPHQPLVDWSCDDVIE